MTYVIHVWEGPSPDGADDAANLIGAPGHGGIVASARFGDFAAALRKKYPDAHMLEAAGKDPEKSVWTDSPLEGGGFPFFVLGLRIDLADYKLMHFLVKTAGAHGLHVYDTQTGQLWRKDDPPPPRERQKPPQLATPEAPLMSLHRFAAPQRWSPDGRPPRPEPVEGEMMNIAAADARRLVFDAIAGKLAACGWREGTGREGAPTLWRTVGPARQVIHVWLGDPSSYPLPVHLVRRYTASFDIGFEIPEVHEALFRIHPRWRKKRAGERAQLGDAYADIECLPQDLFGREMLTLLGYTLISPTHAAVQLRNRREMQWWPQVLTRWYLRQAEPLLAACTDLVTLNRFVNNPWRLATSMGQSEWSMMSSLALARMAPHPEVAWEDILTGVRYRADRLAMDEALLERTISALA